MELSFTGGRFVSNRGELNYKEVLEHFPNASIIRIITYNISRNQRQDKLFEALRDTDAEIQLITNVPSRMEEYFDNEAGRSMRKTARRNIQIYIAKLNPENFSGNFLPYFNVHNHAKIIGTEDIVYIGSANFSNESADNIETGILIEDRDFISKLYSEFFDKVASESLSYLDDNFNAFHLFLLSLYAKFEHHYNILLRDVYTDYQRTRLVAADTIFIETDETRWDATIWYLERFRIAKERINQSDSIEKISFQEVLQPKNRLLLQEYMKYEIGIGELALSTVYERFRTIRNFLQEISELEVTKCDASLIDVYLKNLQNGAMGAKTFNTNVSGIQFFMKFLEVKGYIKKVPFYASYYLEKQIPVHHDRSVEEDVYMEIIQNLSQFPEHLRMMFLHLWCVGLRISEVCTLKGDAYYIQNGDCWMKVYQVKMKNYKRVPIPVTLYRLMQVYLKKHPTKKEAYIFRNRKGGAFSKSTFMDQMKKYCIQIGIQKGEYIFKSHDYRHTVATNFYEHGVSIQSIRDYLGHTFEEMTMQYIDYMPRKIAKENDAYFEEEENSLLACMQKGEKHG